MKTKPSDPVPSSFPTCGEVFEFIVNGLDLPAWVDAFTDEKKLDKGRSKKVSDQLRDWAAEPEGRCPSREAFRGFIQKYTEGLPKAEDLQEALCSIADLAIDRHAEVVRENATYLDRAGTRAWYASWSGRGGLFPLFLALSVWRRLCSVEASWVDEKSLCELIKLAWIASKDSHPLVADCYQFYDRRYPLGYSFEGDAKWKNGTALPRPISLRERFRDLTKEELLDIVLGMTFANLCESLAQAFRTALPRDLEREARDFVLQMGMCIQEVDAKIGATCSGKGKLSFPDYVKVCFRKVAEIGQEIERIVDPHGEELLDLKNAAFRSFDEYNKRFVWRGVPDEFKQFMHKFDGLWKSSSLKEPYNDTERLFRDLSALKADYPSFAESLAGPMLAIEARLALAMASVANARKQLKKVRELYVKAGDASRYRAGKYTKEVLIEAMGICAILYRNKLANGTSNRAWVTKTLGWWDLLQMGEEFDHEHDDRRIERMEHTFIARLGKQIRESLKSAFPKVSDRLGIVRIGPLSFGGPSHLQKSEDPIDKRQKRPMARTVVGRDSSPLMEAIDRSQLERARDLVKEVCDLNFINSTGDTCITKAFAKEYLDLVLEILRRDVDPIGRDTLLRITNQWGFSPIERAISTGQLEILKELAAWRSSKGEQIDLNQKLVCKEGVTPLYHAIGALYRAKEGKQELFDLWAGMGLAEDARSREIQEEVCESLMVETAPESVLDCIQYLIRDEQVELDTPNIYDHSALTLAAELGLSEIVELLLIHGAAVNHRIQGGATALVFAIKNDDFQSARMLIEFNADYRLFLEFAGRPIYALPMSERMRTLIPYRL